MIWQDESKYPGVLWPKLTNFYAPKTTIDFLRVAY
ncbi:MAG: hypothetical protein JWR61_5758 [Ferruginibacter sp.]|nr:hypothetical protein [Ferruginibacter sp.]